MEDDPPPQEEELSHADTISTVMEGSFAGVPDSVYSNYIRKVRPHALVECEVSVVP